MIQQTKLEFTDFSGGITENFIPGDPTRYQTADNLWVERDKMLSTRPGSRLLENLGGQIPNGGIRINEIFPFNQETEMLAVSGDQLFYQVASTAWTKLVGPDGTAAFPGNTAESHVAHAEWRGQVFLTPENLNGPQKIYRDDSNVIQLRQAGLPIPVFTAVTDGDRFSACVAMAVALKSAMITHFGLSGVYTSGSTHVAAQDTSALAALSVPSTNADLATYITTLRSVFTIHITDALSSAFSPVNRVYHIPAQFQPSPSFGDGILGTLNIQLDSSLTTLTSTADDFLVTAAQSLNDLKRKYNWHTFSTLTHTDAWIDAPIVQSNMVSLGLSPIPRNETGFGKNKVNLPDINTGTTIFLQTNEDANLVSYVNNIANEFSLHVTDLKSAGISGTQYHSSPDYVSKPFLPAATNVFEAVTILGHLEFQYFLHYADAHYGYFLAFTGTSTGGSNTITATSVNGAPYIGSKLLPVIYSTGNWQTDNTFGTGAMPIIGGTATTFVISSIATSSQTATFLISSSNYHLGFDSSAAAKSLPTNYAARLNLLDYSLESVDSIITEASAVLGYIKSHEISFRTGTIYDGPTPGTTVTIYANSTTGQTAPSTVLTMAVSPPHTTTLFTYPLIASTNQVSSYAVFDTTPTSNTVLYTAVYRYPYKVGQISFEDISAAPIYQQFIRVASPDATAPATGTLYPTYLTGIPELENSPNTNYDTANIKVDLYRTIAGGTTFYLVGTLDNGVTTFTDNVTDTDLLTRQQLYTTGGVVGNDPPPAAKYITILGGTAYYGNILDTDGQAFPYRVRQSIQNDPDSCPATFYDDLDDEITGLSNFRNYVIVLCKNSIYRLENGFNELGQGFLSHERLTDTVGCVSHSSIVRTEFGIFFCGTNGIYWTDGYDFKRLSLELEKTYKDLINSSTKTSRINGVYLKDTRRVIWAFIGDDSLSDCNIGWTLDLSFGLSERCTFTTLSGGTSFRPSAMAYFNRRWIRGDSRGYVFFHDTEWKSDPVVDTTVDESTWIFQPVIYNYTSCANDFGTKKYKKWATRVTVQAENASNLSLALLHKNDNNVADFIPMTPIRYRHNPLWGDPAPLWGGSDYLWGTDGMVDSFRRIPAGGLRCEWKAIQFTNAEVIICNSDTYGFADTGANVSSEVAITLQSTTYKWPRQCVGNYTISFLNLATGQYEGDYPIIERTSDTVIKIDFISTIPVSQVDQKWIIKGIPLDERFKLESYSITYAPLLDEQGPYLGKTSSDGGQNA